MEEKNILSFEGVTGKKKKFSLHNINFTLEAGYIYGMVGKNGAGKTTLMKYIMEEKSKYTGRILLKGRDIKKQYEWAMNHIGFVSEDNEFFGDRTAKQNAQILSVLYDDFNMDKFLKATDELEISVNKTYKKMSRGEKLKFQLAFAIAHDPVLYLLDEVTVGMDPVFRIQFFDVLRKLIAQESCCVLMTSHVLSEIQAKTDYVARMQDGTLSKFVESIDFTGV